MSTFMTFQIPAHTGTALESGYHLTTFVHHHLDMLIHTFSCSLSLSILRAYSVKILTWAANELNKDGAQVDEGCARAGGGTEKGPR